MGREVSSQKFPVTRNVSMPPSIMGRRLVATPIPWPFQPRAFR